MRPLESDEEAPAVSSHAVTIAQHESRSTPTRVKKRTSIMEFLPPEEIPSDKEAQA